MRSKIEFLVRNPLKIFGIFFSYFPKFRFLRETLDYQGYVSFEFWFVQKVLNIGGNKKAYWPVHRTSKVHNPENILIGVDAYPGMEGGCYITGRGGLEIGNYTQIAHNVTIVTSNHDLYDSRIAIEKQVKIGNYCWLGAGCKVMPGVELGDYTIVAAGAVVTKSFSDGYCVIGGVPAIRLKDLDRSKCIPYENKVIYYGYVKGRKFEEFRKKNLKV